MPSSNGGGSVKVGPIAMLLSLPASLLSSIAALLAMVLRSIKITLKGKNVEQLFGDTYIYPMSQEDPLVDHEILNINEKDNVCTITTGGDNVLDYLLGNPKSVIAIDCNAHQKYLLEMKMACIAALPQEETFRIFASGDAALFNERFDVIAKHLSPGAVKFWDKNRSIFKCFVRSGLAPLVLYPIWFAFWVSGVNKFVNPIFDPKGRTMTFEQQREQYEAKWVGKMNRACGMVEFVFRFFASWAAVMGVPPEQMALLPAGFLFKTLDYLFKYTDMRSNPWWSGYMMGMWTEESVHRWLMPEHYEFVRARLPRVQIHQGFLHETLEKEYPDGHVTKISLLDHMDWLPDDAVRAEWSVFKRKCSPDALIMFRSAAEYMPFKVLKELDFKVSTPIVLGETSEYAVKHRLPVDRVATYHSVHVAAIPAGVTWTNAKLRKINTSAGKMSVD